MSRLTKLMAVFTLLLAFGMHYSYVTFLAIAHYNFYQELAYCVDTRRDQRVPNYVKQKLLDRFFVVKEMTVGPDDEFIIVSTTFSGDAEFIHINYFVNGEERHFTSRYPWKSGPQKLYESNYLPLVEQL